MTDINTLLLLGSLLLFVSVLATTLARFGIPLLVIFLGVGMLAGEDGPGGIEFDDFGTAFLVANLALAIILLDGGLRTRSETFRVALRPALGLATVGVLLTAGLLGVFTTIVLDLDWRYALLLAAIMASTDAAAVFSQLRHGRIALNERVRATLELESGSNDPMAIFLVLALVESFSLPGGLPAGELTVMFLQQFGYGIVGGLLLGRLLAEILARLRLAEGLYALLIASGGLLVFALVNILGGSGFLAIYLLGVTVGQRRSRATEHVLRAMDGLAWLAQAGMFLILGLLITPSEMLSGALPALAVALFLMLVARPTSVAACLAPFRFPAREIVFIGWVGLRGAVPIVLAIFPVMADLPDSRFLFETTFAVVLVSLLIQGPTVAILARNLGLELPQRNAPEERRPIRADTRLPYELVQLRVARNADILGHAPTSLTRYRTVRCVGVIRDRRLRWPRESLVFREGDRALVLTPNRHVDELTALFSLRATRGRYRPSAFYGRFQVRGDITVGDLAAQYAIELDDADPDVSLDTWFRERTHREPVVGDSVRLGPLRLTVRHVHQGHITRLGIKFNPDGE
ncbi:potassium/proton antiporter [Salinisphaera sp. PC39]|uniref:potassium/proton antiporter n=1 Tax=Salinisphaera sp. PC39 TaxID=1304156 RepID=UPI003341D9AA